MHNNAIFAHHQAFWKIPSKGCFLAWRSFESGFLTHRWFLTSIFIWRIWGWRAWGGIWWINWKSFFFDNGIHHVICELKPLKIWLGFGEFLQNYCGLCQWLLWASMLSGLRSPSTMNHGSDLILVFQCTPHGVSGVHCQRKGLSHMVSLLQT